jgi:2'-5' RNA ligase
MRLFIGVELPDRVKADAAAVTEALRNRVSRFAPRASIRWVERANLHITLWFLGEVDEIRAQRLVTVLEEPLKVKPFTVRFDRCGAFPHGNNLRVFWIGLACGTQELVTLHAEVRGRVVPLGFEAEARPYSPHLTVARVKEIRRSSVPAIRKALNSTTLDADFLVTSLTLFRSRLSPKGSQYESVLRVPLH